MGLLDLPPETLLRVSSYLTTPELGNLRRTCKHVEAALFDSFAREFFTKRQFMLEHVSLQTLVDIASHPTLSRRLSEIIIGTQRFPPDEDHGSPCTKAMYKVGYVNHNVLLETGQARDMLVEALTKLPNLRTVGLRDYEAMGRYRDGEDARWRNYGWSYNMTQPPSRYRTPYSPAATASPTSVLPLILYALGHAGARPNAIDVFLRKEAKLTAAAFHVVDGFIAPKVVPVLKSLTRLMLTIAPSTYMYGEEPTDSGRDDSLKRFLQHTPALETLRLNFDAEQDCATPFLNWLGTPVSCVAPTSSVPPVSLSSLSNLDLGMLQVPVATLVSIVIKFNLVSLSLWKVTFKCNPDSYANGSTSRWSAFFKDVAEALPQSSPLKSVLIGYVSQSHIAGQYRPSDRIYFSASPTQDPSERLDKVSWRAAYGGNVRDWFLEMSDRTIVESPPIASVDSDLGDDDEEDEDEDDLDDDENNGGENVDIDDTNEEA